MTNSEKLSSEAMEHLLSRLGFRPSPSAGAQRVFENPEYDAVLLLPPAGKEPFARAEHLLTLRRTVYERGIADAETFEKLLGEARQQAADPLAKAS